MFYVIRNYKSTTPSVLSVTSIANDAKAYAAIMNRSEPEYLHTVLTDLD